MKIRLLHILFLSLLLTACVPVAGRAQSADTAGPLEQLAQEGILFSLTLSDGVYTVWMQTTVTPADPNLTLGIQVTLKVPHGEGDERFQVRNLQSGVQNVLWAQLSRVDAPAEAPTADYISIEAGYIGGDRSAFGWQVGKRVKAFTFENAGSCLGTITLIENSDPFVPPEGGSNSTSTNPGNYIRVVGLGEGNAYSGNLVTNGLTNCEIRSDVRIDYALARSIQQGVEDAIQMLWRTSHEADIIGFNLLRYKGETDIESVNSELIPAQQSGQTQGAAYTYVDAGVQMSAPLTYVLELMLLNGESVRVPLRWLGQNALFLPLISR